MKVSKAKAAEHRAAMLDAASRLFRERGFDGVGIPEIARAAGLTHGAFYTHFASKDALGSDAIDDAITQAIRPIAGASSSRNGLKAFVDYYLSPSYVGDRGAGCPIAALGGDVPRQSSAVAGAFEQALRRFTEAVASLFPAGAAMRRSAIATTAMLVGGVILARAAKDPAFRDEILQAVRTAALKEPR